MTNDLPASGSDAKMDDAPLKMERTAP